jgi:hypothetical protein
MENKKAVSEAIKAFGFELPLLRISEANPVFPTSPTIALATVGFFIVLNLKSQVPCLRDAVRKGILYSDKTKSLSLL